MSKHKIDIACVQETHLSEKNRFTIRGYQSIRMDRAVGPKGGVTILVKNDLQAVEITKDTGGNAEIHGIRLALNNRELIIYNCYCPPTKRLSLEVMDIPEEGCLILGDFNSHSQSCGYDEMGNRGEEVENWQIDWNLQLLNDPDDPDTFYSRRWRTTSTPDLGFATDDLAKFTTRTVQDQLAGSDHRPVMLKVDLDMKRPSQYAPPRWNFKKANWSKYSCRTDILTTGLNVNTRQIDKSNKAFTDAILTSAQECIPRGSRRDYVPHWSEELQALHEEVTEARDQVEADPSVDNNINLKAKTAKFRKESNTATRRSWHEKTAELNLERDGQKLWRLVRSLNGENSRASPIVLEEDNRVLTKRQAANHLVKQFSRVSDISVNDQRKKAVRRELQDRKQAIQEPADEVMTCPFVIEELEAALKDLQTGRNPGPDNITNSMLTHLGPQAKKKLLGLFNTSWKTGLIPTIWKKATLIPIPKAGKPKNSGNSYRPISLTSCMCKLMERMINRRLVWYLERNSTLMDEQAGFRQFRSTEDQITYIAQIIEDGYQRQQHTAIVWVDMEKAFDKVWKQGLTLQLVQAGVSHNMLEWIRQYLSQRTGRVNLQGKLSRQAIFKDGVPQGGVLSPTLFLVFLNSIQDILNRHVKAAIYADDLALICSEDSVGTAQVRLQECLTQLEEWTEDWAMKVNAAKTTYSIFSLSPKSPDLKLKINNTLLQRENYPKYLGVTFDPRLTWCKHIQEAEKKGTKRVALLKKLAGTSWGADISVLKKTYVGYVRPVIEYGMASWGTAAKTNFQKVERVQNQSLRILTGGIKSTPINYMEAVAGLESLEDRRVKKTLTQYTKFRHLTSHPMHTMMTNKPRKRLKRQNFTTSAKSIHKDLDLPDLEPDAPIQTTKDCPPHSHPEIIKDIEGIVNKGSISKSQTHHLTQVMLREKYPSEQWIKSFTDGSAMEATRDGGGGIYIE